MTEFNIRIADTPIRVSALYESTKDYCRDYLTDETPAFSVSVSVDDLDSEREISAKTDTEMGRAIQNFSAPYLETVAVNRKVAAALVKNNTVLIHGSALAIDGQGCIFTAPSGTGKSTHSRIWREVFGKRVIMVNDDKPMIRITDAGAVVYGTPWSGKHDLNTNIGVPLRAICILERDGYNRIERISHREMFPTLYKQCYRPQDADLLSKTLGILDSLSDSVRFYRLGCNMDPSAAIVSYNGIFKEGIQDEA